MFNASAGQSDPYVNIFLRQPIPGTGFLPCHLDAVVDVRNLLAQGYVPALGQAGRTVYLVQSPRSLRGGVSFTSSVSVSCRQSTSFFSPALSVSQRLCSISLV